MSSRRATDSSNMELKLRLVSLTFLLVLINWNEENVFCSSQSINRRLIFEENFDSFRLNKNFWSREIRIPLDPEYQFCVFHKHDDTIEIKNGILRIKPRLFEDVYGENSILLGQLRLADCTSSNTQECEMQAASYHILPPVISAKLITRNHFEFRYGVIEVRAKFPEGDWLYPEIRLEPLYKSYDPRHANARIELGRARGNSILTYDNGYTREDYGGKLLEFGVGNGTGSVFHEQLVTKLSHTNSWTKDFHVYKTTWTSQGLRFHVDDQYVGKLTPTSSGWSKNERAVSDSMAPFDEKFYLSIGLGVGGVRLFPDETQTNSYVKPWKNINAKAMLLFWQAKDKWLPSWQREHGVKTSLEIDYIKVWSLD
ncbi:beta-1,3-glucan-binding protein 1-like [Phymastichus coffea]|uniref:beta-1,3-glucan-binding protein 1-like n=1 Tax=Phymastichus coffea TaxID=108790 RepID=UPI00273B197A|nr:beta-1,3-glucan-binding protein 1-like [Phymastichus coffea]